ncbi:MAG TPA: Ig-like domain-containing protein [Terriglobales bacterium]|nr:Ig-like domain-containing protein [Terriglobales bacterium]
MNSRNGLICALFAVLWSGACSGGGKQIPSGPATLVSISVSPSGATIQSGSTQQFTATGAFSDNSSQILASSVTWASSNTGIATISTAGLLTAVAPGTSTIQAQSNGITGSTTLTVSTSAPPPAAQTDVLTYHNDNARTGQNLQESILTPANVNATNFGKLFVISIDGKVDAQPLYVSSLPIPNSGKHNVLIVASEHDSVYAFDADTGAKLWQISMLKPGETTSDNRSCDQVTPEIGVTATPVIDRTAGPNGTVYVVAMSKDASGNYFQRLHALNLATGAEQFGGPRDVSATFPGTGANSNGTQVVFDPKMYKERPGLLLLNGIVYTSWSSHCDIDPYTGWIIGYDQKTLAQAGVLNVVPNGSEGSFWNSGAGLAADTSGNIFQLVANGTFDSSLNANGFPAQGDFGNAFVKVSTTGGQLSVSDYFALFNTASESASDTDLGSGGAMLLPDVTTSSGIRHLAVGAGKDGNIYVVDRDNMGKFNSSKNNIYQELPSAIGAEFGMPAFFNNTVYYGGVGDNLKAFPIANGLLATTPSSTTANTFGFPGTTPAVSANGTNNGIVWAAENTSTAVLHAYDAGNLSHELYNSNQAANGRDQFGNGNKFIVPTIANGKVYVGTTNGVGVFGLLH